jgi:two-component system sensor histidine kinase/response regulator
MDAVLDRETALERVEGDVELFEELVQLFLEDLPERLSEIRVGLARQDGDQVRRAAHALKGAAANLSALAVAATARTLEEAGRGADFDAAARAYTTLEAEIDRLTLVLAVERG